jgi:hypothetical protein
MRRVVVVMGDIVSDARWLYVHAYPRVRMTLEVARKVITDEGTVGLETWGVKQIRNDHIHRTTGDAKFAPNPEWLPTTEDQVGPWFLYERKEGKERSWLRFAPETIYSLARASADERQRWLYDLLSQEDGTFARFPGYWAPHRALEGKKEATNDRASLRPRVRANRRTKARKAQREFRSKRCPPDFGMRAGTFPHARVNMNEQLQPVAWCEGTADPPRPVFEATERQQSQFRLYPAISIETEHLQHRRARGVSIADRRITIGRGHLKACIAAWTSADFPRH